EDSQHDLSESDQRSPFGDCWRGVRVGNASDDGGVRMTTFLDDEIGRVPGESGSPTDSAAIRAVNRAWSGTGVVWVTVATEAVTVLDWCTPAPVTPRMGYVLTVEVQTDQPAEVRWLIHQTYYDGGTLTLADGAANIDPTTPVTAGAWVATARAWDAPEGIVSGSFVT